MFGRMVYEESRSHSPRQPDWDRVTDPTPPLGTKQFGDLIDRRFPELGPAQVMELVRRFFLELNAAQALALTRLAIPVLTAAQAIGLLQELFPELNGTEVIGLVRRIEFPAPRTMMRGVFRRELPMKRVKIRVDPLLPRGFDLVAGVTSKSTTSHSNLRPLPFVLVQILQ
jgi:hypothetical protein